MKFSLISATSAVALLTAAIGPAGAAVLTPAPSETNLYDLVHDGMTSANGGDATVTPEAPTVVAETALRTTMIGREERGFTGPVDPTALGNAAVPRVVLGAAPGTHPDEDFATNYPGSWQWQRWQRAYAIGMAEIAPLIGTIGNGSAETERARGTVFVAAGTSAGFDDGGNGDSMRSSSVAVAFAPSSTNTATITVAGAGNFRQHNGMGFAVASANSLRAAPPAEQQPARVAADLADSARPTLGYNYAPAPAVSAKGAVVEASFSDAVTASGTFARIDPPMFRPTVQTSEVVPPRGNGRVQTSELLPSRAQPGSGGIETSERQTARPATARMQSADRGIEPNRSGAVQLSDVATTLGRVLDLSQPIDGTDDGIHADGTRTFISASVSANPTTAAVSYMANVVNTPVPVPHQTVEAFEIGPNGRTSGPARQGTTVADPLRGRILASAGPLNNFLALP